MAVPSTLPYSLGDLGLLRSVKTHKNRTEVVVAVPAAGHPAPPRARRQGHKGGRRHRGRARGARARQHDRDRGRRAACEAFVRSAPGSPAHQSGGEATGTHRHDASGRGADGDGPGAGGLSPGTEPFRRQGVTHPRPGDLLGQGRRGQVDRDRQSRGGAGAPGRFGGDPQRGDCYGFSVPSMLGDRSGDPGVVGDLLIPPVAHGVRCISMGFFVNERPGGHVERAHAAQGPGAVPRGRALGPRPPASTPTSATSRSDTKA